jgi:hypothetical protein
MTAAAPAGDLKSIGKPRAPIPPTTGCGKVLVGIFASRGSTMAVFNWVDPILSTDDLVESLRISGGVRSSLPAI